MDNDALIRRLMATFLDELQDHVRALERDLLLLEKETDPAAKVELYNVLFRTAHSLKGAARSVNVGVVETACHRLEEIFASMRDGRFAEDTASFQWLLTMVDTIDDAGKRLRENQDLSDAPLTAILAKPASAASSTTPAEPPPDAEKPVPPAIALPERSRGDSFARVPADKLDALLTRSGELLVARRHAETRSEVVAGLQEFVKGWRTEWARTERAVAKSAGRNAIAPTDSGEEAALPTAPPRQVALALGRNTANLQHLERGLQELAAGLAADHHALEQVADPLDSEVRRIRMLPFAEACEGLDRMVRDLTAAGGKEAMLVIQGGDIELDRSVLEGLRDPLLHLVRNAVDHGIETIAARRTAGKRLVGRITVSAALRGNHIEVVVADDGAGLNIAAIREQMRRSGLPDSEDEEDLAQAIFLPGFSTAPDVTRLSGRGVGLDVVKSEVETMRGKVSVSFEKGRETRFALILPLTLTTIRVLLLGAGGQTFAVDCTDVEKLMRVGPDDLRSIEGREVLSVGESPVPIADLAELLGLDARAPEHEMEKTAIVILAVADRKAAFAVDGLFAEQEVVIRPLGARLAGLTNFNGATILPTGRIALILNVPNLVRAALDRASTRLLSTALAGMPLEARKRLLVVDDSVTTRTLEKSILEAAGYEVLEAADGAEAWQLLGERGADLVVTDVEMPRMDGFGLTEAIRRSQRFRDLPVILVTALETEEDKTRGMQAGANAYLLKSSFDQTNLLETIAQIL